MHGYRSILLAILVLILALPAFAQMPAVGFDIENAMGHNQYFWNFYVNQVLGFSFIVGAEDVTVTHLGLFDMNPDNEPYWDPENPSNADYGFTTQHPVALFDFNDMSTLAEVMIPAGTVAPIVDEGYRYLPLDAPVVLQAGHTYVLAAWYGMGGIATADIDNFYLLGTTETDIPSEVYIHPGIDVYASCMNPNAGDGSTCDPPFVFGMPWPMYAGGPNMLLQGTTATEDTSWGRVKSLY